MISRNSVRKNWSDRSREKERNILAIESEEGMDVSGVLHMNGGDGTTSYAKNSWIQHQVLLITNPIREEAIRRTYHNVFPTRRLAIAELGCSSGPTALFVVRELIQAINSIQSADLKAPNISFYLNDLPQNDFNTIFKSLPSFHERLNREITIGGNIGRHHRLFLYGVPGSFFEQLFESESLHFIHSSYAIHFLSKVPEGLGRSHKGNIYMSRTSSPSVLDAYYRQYQNDFSTFLRYRSKELVNGGCMVLTTIGRKYEDRSSKDGGSYIWELIATALNQLVSEGLIEEEKMDVFNIPLYYPSVEEISEEVRNEGSFTIHRLEISEVDWKYGLALDNTNNAANGGCEELDLPRSIRAVAEPMILDHFGEEICEEVFHRLNQVVANVMEKERNSFFNITVSLMKTFQTGPLPSMYQNDNV